MKLTLGTLVVFLLVACHSRPNLNSELKWAIDPDTIGSPNSLLEAMDLGIAKTLPDLKVCVETVKNSPISDREFFLETQLAFAYWLKFSTDDHRTWERFQFYTKESCEEGDSFIYKILLGDGNNPARTEPYGSFSYPTIDCVRIGRNYQCGGSPVALGVAAPASMTYFFNNRGWTEVALNAHGWAAFSPFADWLSLKDEISSHQSSHKDELLVVYDSLLETIGDLNQTIPFPHLDEFISRLQDAQIIGQGDGAFQTLFDEFVAGNKSSLSEKYRMRLVLFSTLLHEVGHIYGIDHAHAPGQGSLTGASGETTADGEFYQTDLAVMAYGEPYLYLTLDDESGARAASIYQRENLRSKVAKP